MVQFSLGDVDAVNNRFFFFDFGGQKSTFFLSILGSNRFPAEKTDFFFDFCRLPPPPRFLAQKKSIFSGVLGLKKKREGRHKTAKKNGQKWLQKGQKWLKTGSKVAKNGSKGIFTFIKLHKNTQNPLRMLPDTLTHSLSLHTFTG